MFDFLLLLFITIFVVTWFGVIKPSVFKSIFPKTDRVTIFFTGCLINFLVLICMGFATETGTQSTNIKTETLNDKTNEAIKEQPSSMAVEAPITKKNEPIKVESNLGIKPEDFRKKFNAQLKNLEITSVRPVGEFDINKGKVRNTFQVHFSDSLGLNGVVNKDGYLRELTYVVGATTDYENAMMDLLIMTGVTARVLNPSNDKAPPQVVELINAALENVGKKDNVHHSIVGKNKYYAMASEHIGLWVGFAPAKE